MRQLLDHVHQSRRRPHDFFADIDHVPPLDGVKVSPYRARAQIRKLRGHASAMILGENDVIRLQPHYFFKAQVRPVLLRYQHGFGAGPSQRVRNERVLPDRLQRFQPHHKQHVNHRPLAQPRVQSIEPLLHPPNQFRSLLRGANHLGHVAGRIEHPANRLRIARVDRDAEPLQRVGRLECVDRRCRQHQIGMQGHDRFEVGILRIAHVRLRFRRRRRVAKIRVAHQPVPKSQRVDRLGQIRRQRHDPFHFRGDFHFAPHFVGDRAARIRSGKCARRRAHNQRAHNRRRYESSMPDSHQLLVSK